MNVEGEAVTPGRFRNHRAGPAPVIPVQLDGRRTELVTVCDHGRVRSVAIIALVAKLAGWDDRRILASLGRLGTYQLAKLRWALLAIEGDRR